MLDNITKKNIDDCRDVLVGKVPDPKSQIEQITLALIYKFMDDMDQEAVVNFGGKAKFFAPAVYTGDKGIDDKLIDYSKYSWRKLFEPSLSGVDMLALYMDALEKLNTNPNIPELFRNIFKNAYLPYRDPATLKLFLKYINAFEYSHSEKLGDAFEYLLSVMGSQGDAGQFRTPRNIIDFVTACVNPQKTETVLDPACGTAGFLLSAYKHIYLQNTQGNTAHNNIYAYNNLPNDKPIERLGTALTPDQRKKVLSNFVGYDISPDMVRLSLANMYLHGFTTPKIYEYDSLSSEDRWNENYDVILANPPFMTPKGGIRPHKKFGVQANKAEVLFTDYIAEHLNPNGRAGIVVPNGIVATSQTAYKQLRQHLVADSLIAVISLPAGCFNPYSGVKTSVLLLDKRLAKKSKHILFIKVSNDGFDLGAQRREHDKNDLPAALAIFEAYKQCLQPDTEPLQSIDDIQTAYDANMATPALQVSTLASLVAKATVLENKDAVLSADRYFEKEALQTEFEGILITKIVQFKRGTSITKKDVLEGNIPVIAGGQQPAYYHNISNRGSGSITISSSGAYAGFVAYHHYPIFASDCFTAETKDESILSNKFLFLMLKGKQKEIYDLQEGGGQPHIYPKHFENWKIPLPPIEIQQQIVAEIDSYQKIIDGAKQVVNNYKPTITINPDWEMVELGEVCKINPQKSELNEIKSDLEVSFLPMADLNENRVDFLPKEKRYLSEVVGSYTYFRDNDVLLAKVTPCFENGKAGIAKDLLNGIGFGSSEYYVLRCNDSVLPMWVYLQIKSSKFVTEGKTSMSGTSGLQRIPRSFVSEFLIPFPSIEEQEAIVQAIEQEMQLVAANKQLITLFEAKIAAKINSVWGVSNTTQPKPYTTPETELSVAAEEG